MRSLCNEGIRKAGKATLERSKTKVKSKQSPLQSGVVKVCLQDNRSTAQADEEESGLRV